MMNMTRVLSTHAASSSEQKKKERLHPDGTETVRGSCVRGAGRLSIQETYESNGDSFGSGARNEHGLQLRSFRINVPENGKRVRNGAGSIADALRGTLAFSALESSLVLDRRFAGFSGIACGGIVGAAMETQGNWNAAVRIMDEEEMDVPPLTVTGEYVVRIMRPTPVEAPLLLLSRALQRKDTVVHVEMLLCDDISSIGMGEGVGVPPMQNAAHAESYFEAMKKRAYATGSGAFHWIFPRERWSAG